MDEKSSETTKVRGTPGWPGQPHNELELLYRSVPVALCTLDAELRFVRVNERMAQLNGAPVAEHLGRRLSEVTPEFAPIIEPLYREVLRTGRPVADVEVQGTTLEDPATEKRWLASFYPIPGAAGRVRAVVCLVREVTEQREAERALRRSEHKYRFLFESALDGILTLRGESFADCNRAAMKLFGQPESGIVGQPPWSFSPPTPPGAAGSQQAWRSNLRRAYAGEPRVFEWCLQRRDGPRVDVEVSLTLLDVGQEPTLLCHCRDVTRRKRLDRDLRERLGFEELLSQVSTRFVSVPATRVDEAIEWAMGLVSEFLDVDRSAVLELSGGGWALRFTHYWCRPGSTARYAVGDTLRVDDPWVQAVLDRGEVIHAPTLDRLPDEADRYRQLCRAAGIGSLLVVPLIIGGSPIGEVVFAAERAQRIHTAELIPRMRLIGQVLANAIERRRAEEALLESEALSRSILESLRSHIAVLGPDGEIITVNDAWARFAQASGSVVPIGRGDNYLDVCRRAARAGDAGADEACAGIEAVLGGKRERFEFDYTCPTPAGVRWFVMSVTRLQRPEGGAVVAHTDVTELKRAQQRMRDLSGRLISAQEEERRRIARELHDGLNQRVAMLAVELGILGSVQPSKSAEWQSRMGNLKQRAVEISDSVRHLSHELHPGTLEHLGLVDALRSFCEDFNAREHLRVDFTSRWATPHVPIDAAVCVYRVAQEALRNAAKHARARVARVELQGTPVEIALTVADDGVGFDTALTRRKGGLGLMGMEERVRLLKGRFALRAAPGAGTHIEVRVPLPGEGP